MVRVSRSSWAQKYPPLAGIAVFLFIAIAVLPSALTLPQTNPSTTLEYAPVAPQDQNVAPPGGNFSALGLATTSGLTTAALPPPPAARRGPDSVGKNPSTKRCVGNPPRQTEDPLSPPCVAHFDGDNFGATYQGVTAEEVRILIVMQAGRNQCATSKGCEQGPSQAYVDLAEEPKGDEYVFTRALRVWQRYFNDRYQTYNRFVHFYVYYGGSEAPQLRRSEAHDNYAKIRPFAVYDHTNIQSQPYLEVMASKGVLGFAPTGFFSIGGYDERFFAKYPGLLWSYDPTVQARARNFASYVCRQVVPFKVSFSGNDGDSGKSPRLGLAWHDVPAVPQLKLYADVVRREVKACGGNIVDERVFTRICADNCVTPSRDGAENMASFQSNKVSTIIWAGGVDSYSSRSGAAIGYFPEIVVGGDNANDATLTGQWQDPQFWSRAVVASTYTRANPWDETPCAQGAFEADPDMPRTDARNFACYDYDGLRQIFVGIQVAGPKLTPQSMDKGFRAIPSIASKDARVAACFYPAGDYTCLKDATAEWWDPTGDDPESNNSGCWKQIEEGKRYLTGTWPSVDVLALKRPDDKCSTQGLIST